MSQEIYTLMPISWIYYSYLFNHNLEDFSEVVWENEDFVLMWNI